MALGIDNQITQLIYLHCQLGKPGIEKNLEDYITVPPELTNEESGPPRIMRSPHFFSKIVGPPTDFGVFQFQVPPESWGRGLYHAALPPHPPINTLSNHSSPKQI